MKPTDLIPLVPAINAINNGWAFAAFIVVVAVMLYFARQKEP